MTVDANLGLAISLIILAPLAFIDGVVIHLVRERLHRRPEARLEHALHTGRAVLFPFILVLFFGQVAPAAGLALVIVDEGLQIADMAVERRSRAYAGGLGSGEYVLHGIAIGLHATAFAFALLAGPPSALVDTLILVLLPGVVLGAIMHVVLLIPVRQKAMA
jgi:hypothetical protein